jgi:tetratricopeptide (TPR) repeat protein
LLRILLFWILFVTCIGGYGLSSTIEKHLQKVEQLIYQGELKEALNLIEEGIKTKNLSKKNELRYLFHKSEGLSYLGNFQESLELINQVIKENKVLDDPLLQVDALFHKAWVLLCLAKPKGVDKIIEKGMKAIATLTDIPETKIAEERAKFMLANGLYFALLGDFTKSFDIHQESISLAEKSGNNFITSMCVGDLGALHLHFGKPEKSEEYTEKALKIATENGYKFWISFLTINLAAVKGFQKKYELSIKMYEEAFALAREIDSTFLLGGHFDLGNTYLLMFQLDEALESYRIVLEHLPLYVHLTLPYIGYIYFLKNQLDLASEYFLKALKISEKMNDKKTIADIHYYLILISIEQKNSLITQKYLEQLKQISKETSFEYVKHRYQFASILVLKLSGDISDLGKAAILLEEFLKEKDLISTLRMDALYAFLEIRLKELQLSVNVASLREVKKRLYHLEVESEDSDQQWLLANVYRLHSQLALIELKANEAIEFLNKAQIIADKIDVKLLKKEIKEDREKIQQQLIMWNKLQEQKAPISETIKHVSLEKTVKNIKEETVLKEKDKETGKIIEYRKLFALKI